MDVHSNPSRKKVAVHSFGMGPHHSAPKANNREPFSPEDLRPRMSALSSPLYRESHSYKHMHQISSTRSPQESADIMKERDHLQDQILKMLEENSRMIGLLTDYDYNLKKKTEQFMELRELYFNFQNSNNSDYSNPMRGDSASETGSIVTFRNIEQPPVRDFQKPLNKEGPLLKELLKIKAKLGSINVRKDLVGDSNFQIRIEEQSEQHESEHE